MLIVALCLSQERNADVSVYAWSKPKSQGGDGTCGMTTGGPSRLFKMGATWLEVPRTDPRFRFGTWTRRPDKLDNIRVRFDRPFVEQSVSVVAFFRGFKMVKGNDEHSRPVWRGEVTVKNVDSTGFEMAISSAQGDFNLEVEVDWVAHMTVDPTVKSGYMTIDHSDQPKFPQTTRCNFNNGEMAANPDYIFQAWSKIDVSAERNMRLIHSASEISKSGFTWKTESWDDTLCWSARGAWIALMK
ncbi:uncharacterized protein I303_100001 [Kwoniella dejecticola CBS 10117]|uniref:H-type lectin domain-containing protein n=1 Tax=Kwoniella dejecticola CBS 10117 TaxID=1296121 RepID=A0A1A6ADP9_9TREE|nr:uncharacterized protein I303_00001 [Kwoniella dejecticola CBS 10117]OBR88190.1 hypothetical protein I303_00001 [Kwoniella dejecticola CBS 10117]